MGDLGDFQVATDGTLALDGGIASLRKRVIRRLITPRGTFAHLPDYGVTIPIKQLIRAGRLREIQTEAELQIGQEPDVAGVKVVAVQRRDDPSVVSLVVTVRTQLGREEQIVVTVGSGG